MLDIIEKKLILSTAILIVLLTTSACRSTLSEPIKKIPLNAYNQIDTLTRRDPDSRGIITYETYQILVANGEETILQIANRLDINGEKLALYNGLIPNYRPRSNEIVALPGNQFVSSSGWSTEITQEAIQKNQSTLKKLSSADNPIRHRVKKGESVYSVAREYNVSVNSLATWNGLGPDLDIKTGREIIIPAAAILRTNNQKKTTNSEVKLKQQTVKKLENIVVKNKPQESSSVSEIDGNSNTSLKNLREKTPPVVKIVSVKPFIAPVKGIIVNYYTQNKGSSNNNGVDYETSVSETVKAVADGTIVLISDIVGGSGKIILVRHEPEFITIYGRITNIQVKKGQKVKQGEKIGEVIVDTKTDRGLMHFEVRKGMKSIDPETMIR